MLILIIVLMKMILILFVSLIRLLPWHIKFEKRKTLKKKINEELMPIAWHPERWWHFCVSEVEKK